MPGKNYMKLSVGQAIHQCMNLKKVQKVVKYQELTFTSPVKWVVALMGDFNGLTSVDNLPCDPSINLLLVYFTKQTIKSSSLSRVQAGLRLKFNNGGVIIVRYKGTAASFGYRPRHQDQLQRAIKRIHSCISLYPSQSIPIIEEEIYF